ncbi:MAG: hypothetical protein V3V08_04195, partial [Nannocystaceae bacterium]
SRDGFHILCSPMRIYPNDRFVVAARHYRPTTRIPTTYSHIPANARQLPPDSLTEIQPNQT